ncbi:carboxypeptidase regulatory-like domain-containing protein, partial [Candidatus Bathyarchaeota archaeon]|nr:carboxypeptidase regulatory-like domain-containing protein [Candidatus Bathyarchaeota archaeon]
MDEQGSGLGGVQVAIYASSGALVANASTRSDGFFYAILEYGTYSIYFTKPGYAKVTKTITIQKSDTNLGTIELGLALRLSSSTLGLIIAPGSKVSVPFTLTNLGEGAEIVGFLVSKPEGWSARVLDQSREVMMAYIPSGQNLQFLLEISVPAASISHDTYEVSITAMGTVNATIAFKVKVGEKIKTYGMIVDESRKGLEGVQIDAFTSEGSSIGTWVSSYDGTFNLELPASIAITLSFSKPGYAKVTKTITLYGSMNLGNISLSKAVRLSSSTLGLVTNPGGKLLIPFVISNVGTESEVVEFSTFLPEGWTARVLSGSGQEVSRMVVSPGVSTNLQLEVMIPFAKMGDYEVI